MSVEKDLTRNFSIQKPRFEDLLEDPRLFDATREALKAVAEAGVQYPTKDSPKSECEEWWKKMGPVFADVMAGWVEDTPESIQNVVETQDVTLEEVPVRIYKHKDLDNAKNNIPVIVYLHGGGFTAWSFADKTYNSYLTRLAALGKAIIVAADYRPAHTYPFPTGLEDCYKVTKWVAQGGAESHGVPAGKVVVAGDSSGTNLAFAVTLKAKREGIMNDTIAGLYYLCPYFAGGEKTPDYPSMMECDGLFASEGFLTAVDNNLCKEEEKEEWFKNPLLWSIHATKEDMEGMPPSSIIVMQLDMIRDQGFEMHYKLKSAGVESYITTVSGGVHEQQLFSMHSPYVTEQSIQDFASFAGYCCSKK